MTAAKMTAANGPTRRSIGPGTRVLLALVAATVLGIAIGASGSTRLASAADAIGALGSLWVNAVRMTVIPLVVALIIVGIAGSEEGADNADGRTETLGVRTIVVFLLLLAGTAAVVVPLAPLAFRSLAPNALTNGAPALPPGAAEAARQVGESGGATTIGAWVSTLLPSNPIAAAANGAMLQLVLFTILFALALLRLPPAARAPMLGVMRATADTMSMLVRGIIALAPIGVFALLLPLVTSIGSSFVGAIGLYVVVYSLACVVVTLLLYPVVRLATGVPIARFASGVFPVQSLAFTSSSSVASLPAMITAADGPLALPPRAATFVLPLAVSTFKLASPVAWAIGASFIGWFYGIPLGAASLAVVAFAAVFLSFAAPGVPNGAFLLLTPLFVQIGLPAEGIGVLIAIDAIPDRFSTVLNATGDVAAAAIATRGTGSMWPVPDRLTSNGST